jgi:hypothetical protein
VNPYRLGEAIYIEGRMPAHILALDPEKRMALVGYEGERCRCGCGQRHVRRVPVPYCLLEREPRKAGVK